MSDDWQVGDLALALALGPNPKRPRNRAAPGHNFPRAGGIYTVEQVITDYYGTLGLILEGHHSDHPLRGWTAAKFRKIRPLTDEEHRACIVELAADQRMPADAQIKRPGHPIPVHVAAHASASISQGR